MSGRSPLRNLLLPLIPAYRAGLALREVCLRSGREPIRRLGWPVISVGNLSTGGAGKTPLVIALAGALTRRGVHVDVLSRGYGGAARAAAPVDPKGAAEQFGDEPLLIARETGVRVYVAAQRFEGGLLAEAEFAALKRRGLVPAGDPDALKAQTLRRAQAADALNGHDFIRAVEGAKSAGDSAAEESLRVHLLDDGFQHRQLARDVDIVLLNRRDWGDFLLPAGNLREPVEALRRAHVIAIPAEEPPLETALRNFGWSGPVWRVRRQMDVPHVAGPVVAFCGIARPEQFFAGLEAAGLQVASRIIFRDHHRYVQHDIDCLLDAARSGNAAALLTTEKDRVRLGALAETLAASAPLRTATLRVEIEDEAAAIEWMLPRIEARSRPAP